jgi:putative RecB family exonuclease
MAFPVPVNLSPSRVEAFTSCLLAFRFASIEKLPEPPRPPTTKGSLVHRPELLFADHRLADRTLEAG